MDEDKKVEYLVVDTTAFIQNAALQEIGKTILTCQEVVDEITSRRQLKRLVVLPYDLIIKDVFPENIRIVTEFSKKTGDYRSLSATDIKVMALTYQLEKEKIGTAHLRSEPVMQKAVVATNRAAPEGNPNIAGFYFPGKAKPIPPEKCDDTLKNDETYASSDTADLVQERNEENVPKNSPLPDLIQCTTEGTEDDELDDDLLENLQSLRCADDVNLDDILVPVENIEHPSEVDDIEDDDNEEDDDDDETGWITPSNVQIAKKQVNSKLMEEKHVKVACMTTDFAMQNVLKQMNLNVAALDGLLIKQLRTYILRCYACFKTTSIMTKQFCPNCGNNTLKKVAASLDENGKLVIHINTRRPLTARGKKFSLPRIKGGKHPNNPRLVEDQPMADNKPTRLAKTKNNPLDDDYIAGFSPFVTRDVNSKSAQLGIRPGQEVKYWMKKNPNEARKKRK